MGLRSARPVPWGAFISSTMMVMMIAMTPSLKASSRFFCTSSAYGAELELLQEAQDGVRHFAGALLLSPVAAAREDRRAQEGGHEPRQVRDELIHPWKGDHEVAIACDVQGRHCHARAGVRSQKLPVAIDVAIPVESAPETRVRELAREHVDVGLRDPAGQNLGHRGAIEHSAAPRHHRRADKALGRAALAPFSREGIEKPWQSRAYVGIDLSFG